MPHCFFLEYYDNIQHVCFLFYLWLIKGRLFFLKRGYVDQYPSVMPHSLFEIFHIFQLGFWDLLKSDSACSFISASCPCPQFLNTPISGWVFLCVCFSPLVSHSDLECSSTQVPFPSGILS